jgi:hypothetical protein
MWSRVRGKRSQQLDLLDLERATDLDEAGRNQVIYELVPVLLVLLLHGERWIPVPPGLRITAQLERVATEECKASRQGTELNVTVEVCRLVRV